MSVAFTKEDSAETASETLLPDRPISPHSNLVTEAGLKALETQLDEARAAQAASLAGLGAATQEQERGLLCDYVAGVRARLDELDVSLPQLSHPALGRL